MINNNKRDFLCYSLTETNIEKDLCTSNATNPKNCRVTIADFATRLNVNAHDPAVKDIFNIFNPVSVNFFYN